MGGAREVRAGFVSQKNFHPRQAPCTHGIRFYLQIKKAMTIILHLKKMFVYFDEVEYIINNLRKRCIWKAKK